MKHTHQEKHFQQSEVIKDIVIGMADGLTGPFALAAATITAAARAKKTPAAVRGSTKGAEGTDAPADPGTDRAVHAPPTPRLGTVWSVPLAPSDIRIPNIAKLATMAVRP